MSTTIADFNVHDTTVRALEWDFKENATPNTQHDSTVRPHVELPSKTPLYRDEMEALGLSPVGHNPYALFQYPPGYYDQHADYFARSYILPSLGSLDKRQADRARISHFQPTTDSQQEHKVLVEKFLNLVHTLDTLSGDITAKMGMALPG